LDNNIDPVCGMTVSPDTKLRHEHAGKTYLFCSPKCQTKFSADPEKYLHPAPAEPQVAIPGAVYICPMDPEVRELKPGPCPICGMALEPEDALPKPDVTEYFCPIHALRAEGQTVVFVAIDNQPAGLIGVVDPIKESALEAVRALQAAGLELVMLTGDSRATAEAVANKLGIKRVVAEVLPEQKVEIVKQLQAEGRIVAMAGDGINDAPALAQAQVGIAMGTGTDVAMQSAGVTLVKGDLNGIVRARRLSQSTMRNIRQNLFFAFVYNMLGVPIAAGLLYPFFGLLLSPIIAAAAMSFSSVSVITNALRLGRMKL
jgi:cation transport ATPase